MFPEDIQFSVQPRMLQHAVENLPESKGRVRKSVSKLRDIRNKLLQVPTEKLTQWKMRSNMLDLMPYLASEMENIELRERVLAISINAMSTMSIATLSRLIPFLYRDRAFVESLNARLVTNPPTENPSWLVDHWKAFRKEDPAHSIAEKLLKEQVPVVDIQRELGMLSTNILLQDIIAAYVEIMDISTLKSETFLELLRHCQGGFPLSAQRSILCWMLEEYLSVEQPLSIVQENSPVRELVLLALNVLGPPTRKDWEELPQMVQFLAHSLWLEEQLYRLLGQGDSMRRARWWRRWIRYINDIHYHRPSGKIFIYCQNFVCVESLAVPLWLHIYPTEELQRNIQAKIWQPMPFNITIPSVEKQRTPGWQLHFDDWMRKRCKGRPERW